MTDTKPKMIRMDEINFRDVELLHKQIEVRQEILKELVGTLYPGIVHAELYKLRIWLRQNRDIRCLECWRPPYEIDEYVEACDDDETPANYVAANEGTYNQITGKFWCTSCYIKLGMPLGHARIITESEEG